MRRSCTHSMHALLSTVPAWLFFVSRLFQGPDGSDTHLIESASCCPIGYRTTSSSWRSRPARCVFRSRLPFHRLQSEC